MVQHRMCSNIQYNQKRHTTCDLQHTRFALPYYCLPNLVFLAMVCKTYTNDDAHLHIRITTCSWAEHLVALTSSQHTHLYSYFHWSHLHSHTYSFLYPGSHHSDTFEYRLKQEQRHKLCRLPTLPTYVLASTVIDLGLTITLAKKMAIIYHSCFIMETLLLHKMASFALVLAMYSKITLLGVPEEGFKAINQ